MAEAQGGVGRDKLPQKCRGRHPHLNAFDAECDARPALIMMGASNLWFASTQSIIVNAVLFVAQAGTAFIALRQMGRQDGFLPYLVASNWVTLVSAVLLLLSTLLGPLGLIILVAVVIVAIATVINIGRLIVTLTPLQIGILFISQAVGVFVALAIVAVIIGPPATGV